MRYVRTILLVTAVVACMSGAAAVAEGNPDTGEADIAQANLDGRSAQENPPQRMLIPAYWYPGDDGPFNPAVNWWQLPCNRVQGNGAIVVMNQSNGKFTEQDPNYRAGKALCQAAGADVIGYVTTGGGPAHRGGRRLLSSVKANVDAYYNLYRGRPGRPGMDGIFFDQMQNNPNNVGKRAAQPGERRNKRYYRLLYNYCEKQDRTAHRGRKSRGASRHGLAVEAGIAGRRHPCHLRGTAPARRARCGRQRGSGGGQGLQHVHAEALDEEPRPPVLRTPRIPDSDEPHPVGLHAVTGERRRICLRHAGQPHPA
jgi:hypothetical protein